MNRSRLILAFVLFLSAAWHAVAAEKIVILGSSTAAGIGPSDSAHAWVSRYRRYVAEFHNDIEIVNLAVGGYTTFHIMPDEYAPPDDRPSADPKHNISQALALSPKAIIVNLPSNDAASGYSVEEQLENYDILLARVNYALLKVRASGIAAWIATTQPRNLDAAGRQNLIAMRDSTLARFSDLAIDFWTGLANEDGTIRDMYNSGDNVHLNDSAHGLLFERVVKAGVAESIFLNTIQYSLKEHRPQPRNSRFIFGQPRTTIPAPADGIVRLVVYDARGRAIASAPAVTRRQNPSRGTYVYSIEGIGVKKYGKVSQR